MVKLSLWDKEKSPAEGTSFTPTFSSSSKRPRTAPAAPSSSSLPSLLRLGSDAPPQPELPPIITLKLSSPSFLDSVVHDGLSDNPLYVMETQDNTTKVRRSDPKGFINVARVRWRQDAKSSRKSRELVGIQVAFGKGQWKPAEEFLGYSYGSLLNYRKFYLPHHPHSMRWRRIRSIYYCTTANVKGPVAILEPAILTAPPQLKVFDPLHQPDASRPQRTHGGVPLSLLDFLLVTAMLLTTDSDEWTNVTRAPPNASRDPPEEQAGPSRPSRYSQGSSLSLSSAGAPSTLIVPNTSPESAKAPAIERWRHTVPPLRTESPDILRPGSPNSPVRTSRASQSSESTDQLSTPASPGPMHPFSLHSPSSSMSQRQRYSSQPSSSGPLTTRELPVPPIPVGTQPRPDQPWLAGSESPGPTSAPTSYPYASMRGQSIRVSSSSSSLHMAGRSLPIVPMPTPPAATEPPAQRPRPAKAPPNYLASAHDSAVEGAVVSMHGLTVQGAGEIARDPPPAYSAIDTRTAPAPAVTATATAAPLMLTAHPPLRAVNGDPDTE